MRILVGTLYTIENEFDDCCRAIAAQSHSDFEHFVLRNLPNKNAHDSLYLAFMARADEFDLFMKVDADMVIRERDFFRRVVDAFEADDELDVLHTTVQDFLSNQSLWGLATYRNTVRWNVDSGGALFVDRVLDRSTVRKKLSVHSGLAPAATHCANPSIYQAFHFGCHRALKALDGREDYQWQILRRVYRNYLRTGDRRVGAACLGAELILRGNSGVVVVSEDDAGVPTLYRRAIESGQFRALPWVLRRHRLARLAFLPSPHDMGFCLDRWHHMRNVAGTLRQRFGRAAACRRKTRV